MRCNFELFYHASSSPAGMNKCYILCLYHTILPSFFICSNSSTTCNFTEHNEQDNKAQSNMSLPKLLGLHLDASLSRMTHINTIVSKAINRLYFLKQLKRLSRRPTTPTTPFLHCSNLPSSRVRPTVTRAQSYQLESIQKRAVHIFSHTRGMSYPNVLFVANLNPLKDRRDQGLF